MLIGAAAAAAVCAGFAAVPSVLPHAAAREIVVAPPGGAPMSFADLIQRVSPAVVSIAVKQKVDAVAALDDQDMQNLPPGFEEFLRRFPQQRRPREAMALGSGFFISDGGVIVTNHHVIEDASEIKIKTSEGKEYDVAVVGSDPLTDIAVLRVKAPDRKFAFVKFDREADLRVGDWVVAVGNPFGLDGTATAGIVSAKGRRDPGARSAYTDFIQIDAPINRGNSGGPTFDLQGRVIGVNSAIYSPTGGSVGIGFAIPSESAAAIVDKLLASGKVTRGWLGVTVQPLDDDLAKSLGLPDSHGAMVAAVMADGPAARGGVREGDVILKIEGAAIDDSRDLTRRVGSLPVGRPAQLEILRDGRRQNVSVKLAERPGEQDLASIDPRNSGRASPQGPSLSKQSALGVQVRPISPDERQRLDMGPTEGGLFIVSVDDESDLAKKGVQPGDVIISAGAQALRTPADLTGAVNEAARAKRPVRLLIEGRGGRRYVAAGLKAS
ncbi:MAG: Do family serine endopeptidase [Hyphomonadaceae bacterium]